MKRIIGAATIAATLAGCAQMQAAAEADRLEADRLVAESPVCDGEKQCAEMWDAAQLWVQKNAGMKIQTVTSVIIETFNSVGSSTNLAFSVRKEPLGGGRYRLVGTGGCANLFGCTPPARESVARFNAEVSTYAR